MSIMFTPCIPPVSAAASRTEQAALAVKSAAMRRLSTVPRRKRNREQRISPPPKNRPFTATLIRTLKTQKRGSRTLERMLLLVGRWNTSVR